LPLVLVDEAIEAADTIIYCAMHQKRIIGDILTLSRLDSNLLLVSPEAAQPIQLVRSTLKMFEVELKRAEIKLDFIKEKSLETLQVHWVSLDTSRILQVLINLITNAIKFTRTEAQRHMTITMGASLTEPSKSEDEKEYVQKSQSCSDQTMKPEWGDGQIVYLIIAVKDTGRGLSKQERKNLFRLFQQASPKTYVQYGGSDLGLVISRQLVEMHGGKIGVASETGKGSTFRFYVKTRRTSPSTDTAPEEKLLMREDALHEACTVEIPTPQNGIKMSDDQPQTLEKVLSLRKPQHFQPFYILVVEDNLVNQKVVAKQLRKSGHIVSVANHGEEALDILRRSEYWDGISDGEKLSIILMDVEMPAMDGTTCVKEIRELQALGEIRGHVPVIAVTANARRDQIKDYVKAGMVRLFLLF
jgi:CheY-like chemotaxis protein